MRSTHGARATLVPHVTRRDARPVPFGAVATHEGHACTPRHVSTERTSSRRARGGVGSEPALVVAACHTAQHMVGPYVGVRSRLHATHCRVHPPAPTVIAHVLILWAVIARSSTTSGHPWHDGSEFEATRTLRYGDRLRAQLRTLPTDGSPETSAYGRGAALVTDAGQSRQRLLFLTAPQIPTVVVGDDLRRRIPRVLPAGLSLRRAPGWSGRGRSAACSSS